MTVLHSAAPQRAADAGADALARLAAMQQEPSPGKRTVIRDGDKTVTISTDKNGNTSIERSNGASGPDVPLPPIPPMPGTTVSTSDDGAMSFSAARIEDMTYAFLLTLAVVIIGWPIARAFGRRIERRAESTAIPPATADQLRRIEQAVEAMAIEVERISESQRFIAKVQSGATADRV